MAARTKKKVADEVEEFLDDDAEDTDDLLSPDTVAERRTTVDDEFDEDSLIIDFDQVDESAASFAPLPAGTYECFIEQFELKRSQAGNPMIAARYKITEGEYENRLFFDHFVLNNEVGQARLKKTLMVLGLLQPGSFNIKQFVESGEAIGVRCRVKVAITFNKDRGERQNQVREVLPSAEDDPFFS